MNRGAETQMARRPGLEGLQETLLVHCRSTDLDAVCESVDGLPYAGVILNEPNIDRACSLVERLDPARTLLDAAAYAGKGRRPAAAPFTPRWIQRQRDLGLITVPDAGYAYAGDEDGLRQVLKRTADLQEEAIAPLALHSSWLDRRHGLPLLERLIADHAVPVALILEHKADPLGVRRTLEGLLHLVRNAPVPVLVLRCDISAIGLLSHGAHAAAVGTTTVLRHNYPIVTGGGGRPASIAAVVEQCLAYVSVDRVAQAVQADPDNDMWVCRCRTCAGQAMDWFRMTPDVDKRERDAFCHSIETLQRIRSDLLLPGTSTERRAASWAARCDNALFRLEEVGAEEQPWRTPPMLEHWTALRPPTRVRPT